MTDVKLIEFKIDNGDSPIIAYRIKVNGQDQYSTPFYHITEAKAAAFDECLRASHTEGKIYVSYLSLV